MIFLILTLDVRNLDLKPDTCGIHGALYSKAGLVQIICLEMLHIEQRLPEMKLYPSFLCILTMQLQLSVHIHFMPRYLIYNGGRTDEL